MGVDSRPRSCSRRAPLLRWTATLLLLAATPVAAQDDWQVTRPRHAPDVVARYRAMLERNPDDAYALKHLLGGGGTRALDALIRYYRARADLRPTDANLQHLLGHLYRRAGNAEEALRHYEAAVRLDPARATVQVALGDLWRQQGRLAEARGAYERALAHGAARKPLLRALADLAFAAGDVAEARARFDELIKLDPGDLALRSDYAEALARHDHVREALAELRAIERRQRGDPLRRLDTLKREGAALEKLGDDPGALAVYDEALRLAARGHWLRRELLDRIIAVNRRRETLHALVAELERRWTSRGFFEWEGLARLYEETGDSTRALEAYRKACAADRTAVATRERLIRLLDRLGDSAGARAEYERLIALAPGEPRYQLELAERLFRSGERARALALLRRCAARFPRDAAVHATLADLYARWGEADLALRESELLVRAEPRDENHLINLGEQWFQRGKRQRALEIWRRLPGIFPRRERGLARLAEVLADHDLLAEAVELYRKALRLAPTDPELHRGLALVRERQRRTDEALIAWEHVLEHATTPTSKGLRREARSRIVGLLAQSRRLSRWIEQQRLRLLRDPGDPDAAFFLVEAYLRLGRPAEAETILDRLLAAKPADADALTARVKVYRMRHKLALAIADLKRLVELQPSRARDHYEEMAALAFALNRDDEALAYANLALRLAPADAQARAHLAEAYERRDDYARAVAEYRKAIELAPHQFPSYFAAARLLGRLGDPAAAAELYREVVRRAADDEVVVRAGRDAIDIQEYLGTLGQLERELWPLAFAAGRRPVYRKLLVELYDRYAPPLIERADRGDPAARAELGHLGEHGLAPLLEALGDEGTSQQRLALMLLGHFANRSAAPALLRIARAVGAPPHGARLRQAALAAAGGKTRAELRVLALYAAGRLGDPRTLGDLLTLAVDRDVTLRAAAVWGLARQQDRRAAAALVSALADTKREVQTLACLGLGMTRPPHARDALSAVVGDRARAAPVRAACAFALGLLGDAAAVPTLATALESGDAAVATKAAVALGMLGDTRATGPLLRAYFALRGPARTAVLRALARLAAPGRAPAPAALPRMPLDASAKPDLEALLAALDPHGGPSGASRAVVGHTADVVAGVVAALLAPATVARTLAELDGGGAALGLGPLLDDLAGLPAAERRAVHEVLTAVGAALGPPVRSLLAAPDARVRRRALLVASRLGLPEATAAIAHVLDQGADPARRAAAITAAGRLAARDCAVARRLAAIGSRHLGDAAWTQRLDATLVLERVAGACGAVARPALARAARDANGFVREAAANGLAQAAPTAEIPTLEATARDEADAVRVAAARALGRALEQGAGTAAAVRARKALIRMTMLDPSPEVRTAARAQLPHGRRPVRDTPPGAPSSRSAP